jgi:GT2 family glycosyltransferase
VQQSRVPDEIWVIDDASTDDTEEIVTNRFPSVKYVKLPKNVGVIRARNVALKSARDTYLLLLDDDSWFVEGDGLARCIAIADENPQKSIFALNVCTADGHRHFPDGTLPHSVRSFQGCAVLFNMQAVSQHGLLFEELFDRQGEEKDMCLRASECGLSIWAIPEVEVFHAVTMAQRNWSKIRFFEHRNDVLRELLRCPTKLLPVNVVRTWASHSRYNLLHGYWLTDLRVAFVLPWMLKQAKSHRVPVSRDAYLRWGCLESRKSPGSAAAVTARSKA